MVTKSQQLHAIASWPLLAVQGQEGSLFMIEFLHGPELKRTEYIYIYPELKRTEYTYIYIWIYKYKNKYKYEYKYKYKYIDNYKYKYIYIYT